jgi:hypothetical protein
MEEKGAEVDSKVGKITEQMQWNNRLKKKVELKLYQEHSTYKSTKGQGTRTKGKLG